MASLVNVARSGIHGRRAARTLISRIQCGTAPVRAALGKRSPLSVILIRSPGRWHDSLRAPAPDDVRAHRPEAAALPADVNVVTGDSMTAWAAFPCRVSSSKSSVAEGQAG